MVLMLSEVALPDDGVKHQESAMSLFVNGEDAGSGVLCVAESRLAWRDAQGHGVSVEYPRVSLHAVSRDPNTFPQHHLYVMLNGKLRAEDAAGDGAKGDDEEEEDDDDDDDDDDPITELRFVPRDSSSLEALFTAMCECQALHPDLDEVLSEDDIYDDNVGEGDRGNGGRQGWYGDQEGLGMLTNTGRAALAHLDGLLADASGRAPSFGMGGVRERNGTEPDDGMEVDATSQIPPHGETGQFDDADDDV